MADDFNNASRFYRFTIPTHRRGPHLFHDTGVQNQFSQYSQLIATAFYAACFSRAKFRGAQRWKQLNRNRWPDWSENQHKRSSRTLRLPPFLKCARFCNLNCLSQRVKFWVKFPGENRCKYWSVNKRLLRMFSQLIGLVKNAITKTNPEFWTTPARLN